MYTMCIYFDEWILLFGSLVLLYILLVRSRFQYFSCLVNGSNRKNLDTVVGHRKSTFKLSLFIWFQYTPCVYIYFDEWILFFGILVLLYIFYWCGVDFSISVVWCTASTEKNLEAVVGHRKSTVKFNIHIFLVYSVCHIPLLLFWVILCSTVAQTSVLGRTVYNFLSHLKIKPSFLVFSPQGSFLKHQLSCLTYMNLWRDCSWWSRR